MKIRTRLAPSPTGEIHIGTMRTLLYDYALAKKTEGSLILRIEDTDQERLVEGALERSLEVIKDYGISWDEGPVVGGSFGPYIQSQRLEIYKKYAEELVEKDHAYYCFCSKERLEELRKSQQEQKLPVTKYDKHCLNLSKEEIQKKLNSGVACVIRLKVPENEIISFDDEILGQISFPSNDIDDQVLLKSDGFPTYHLGVVVDDHLMEITHILRGVEWLPSTPKHILLYKAFGWDIPKFLHLPLLKEMGSNTKLSKRNGSVSAAEFLKDGYLPEALLNFLMFLGWNPGTEKEIYSLEEFIEDFSIERIHKSDFATFDRDKLLWLNGLYIRNTETSQLLKKISNWSEKYQISLLSSKSEEDYVIKALDTVKERMKTLSEYNDLVDFYYKDPVLDPDLIDKYSGSKERTLEIIKNFFETFSGVHGTNWNTSMLDSLSHEKIVEWGYSPKEAFMTLRAVITGKNSTPPIFDVLEVLGKKKVIERLQKSI